MNSVATFRNYVNCLTNNMLHVVFYVNSYLEIDAHKTAKAYHNFFRTSGEMAAPDAMVRCPFAARNTRPGERYQCDPMLRYRHGWHHGLSPCPRRQRARRRPPGPVADGGGAFRSVQSEALSHGWTGRPVRSASAAPAGACHPSRLRHKADDFARQIHARVDNVALTNMFERRDFARFGRTVDEDGANFTVTLRAQGKTKTDPCPAGQIFASTAAILWPCTPSAAMIRGMITTDAQRNVRVETPIRSLFSRRCAEPEYPIQT